MSARHINIITVHHWDARWIELQNSQLARHVQQPYTVWASIEGVGKEYEEYFDVIVPCLGKHEGKLNLIAAEVCAIAEDDELMMFIDGDAFPIACVRELCEPLLELNQVVAIQRRENHGDVQPHPSFSLMEVRTWKEMQGDWSMGHPWIDRFGERVTDVGGNMLRAIERNEAKWFALTRSNRRNFHPLWFGVYGHLVYHHGAGFRSPFSRIDADRMCIPRRWAEGSVVQRRMYGVCRRVQARRCRKLSQNVFELLSESVEDTVHFVCGDDGRVRDPEVRRRLDRLTMEIRT